MFRNLKFLARGFSLIELMVAVSIFAIVALIVSGAVITANRINEKAQAIKVVMDSLHFAVNSISFNLQDGGLYYCEAGAALSTSFIPTEGHNCPTGESSLAFRSSDLTRTYLYKRETINGRGVLSVSESGAEFVPITSPDLIDLQSVKFFVKNSEELGGLPSAQPLVTVVLLGEGGRGDLKTSFALQTTISER